jgi:hypothetical protein
LKALCCTSPSPPQAGAFLIDPEKPLEFPPKPSGLLKEETEKNGWLEKVLRDLIDWNSKPSA